ncbi:MAG: DUF58 domain-containing protein [Gammaproteobacteria bacterium]|nr:DUF58 domain-containing protein [Gammaproteobacteria bacterium]
MRGWLLRWFPLATRAGRAFGERFTPLGKWLLATAGLAGIFSADPTRTHAFLLFGATSALLTVGVVGSLVSRPQVRARRELPPVATHTCTTHYVIELHNVGRRALDGCRLADRLRLCYPTRQAFADEIADAPDDNWFDRRIGFLRWQRLRQRLQGATLVPAGVAPLAPGRVVRVALDVTPLRRGWLQFDAVRVLHTEPLGLCHTVVTLPLAARLLCRPPVVAMPAFRLPQPGVRPRSEGQARRRDDGAAFFALREYRPGDPPKHIDWRSSARRAQPVVRQFASATRTTPRILVDPAAGHAQRDFETMTSVAASVFVAAHEQGPVQLVLLGTGQPPLTTPGDALDALALLEPTRADTRPAWAAVLDAAAPPSGVLVCARWDAARAACVATVPRTRALLVLCTDPRAAAVDGVVTITQPAVQLPALAWPAPEQAYAS